MGISKFQRLDPPSGFDITRYNGTAKLTAWGWCVNLRDRRILKEFLLKERNSEDPLSPEVIQRFESRLDHLFETPLLEFPMCEQDYPSAPTAISHITVGKAKEYIKEADPFPPQLVRHHHLSPYSHKLVVEVDLVLPDSVLVKRFRDFLKQNRPISALLPDMPSNPRKESKRKRDESAIYFTDQDFHDWSEYRVLPYIDLALWAQRTGKRISDAWMYEFLYEKKDYNKSDRTLAQKIVTARKWASKLLAIPTLKSLERQASN